MKRAVIFKSLLYVAGDALSSTQALAKLAALCMTPTLNKLAPSLVRRIVGTLSQTQTVLLALVWKDPSHERG